MLTLFGEQTAVVYFKEESPQFRNIFALFPMTPRWDRAGCATLMTFSIICGHLQRVYDNPTMFLPEEKVARRRKKGPLSLIRET